MLDGLLDAIFDFISDLILYPIGWPVVKLFTLGKYPVRGSWFAESAQANWTRAIGLAVVVVSIMVVARQF